MLPRRSCLLPLLVLSACASKPAAGPAAPTATEETPAEPSTDEPAAEARVGEPASPSSEDGDGDVAAEPADLPGYEVQEITKIRECDEYLALYRFCEPRLEEEIMAGDRRTYQAERASLVYFLTTPESAGLPDACAEMLRALETDCLQR